MATGGLTIIKVYNNLEQLLLKAVHKETCSSDFDFVTTIYESDFNVYALEILLLISPL